MAFLKGKIDIYKIPSGEITNLPYLRKVADLNLPIVMSTGMSTLEEVQTALDILMENGVKKQDIIVLHCNTEYPTPMEDVNLKAMITMREKLDVKVGYSDHSLGIEVPVAAVALGAKVVEKHFTLDKTMDGPDHRASLEPRELKDMVKAIRNIEKAMGSGEKVPSASEKKNIAIARKSIVAAKNIHKGERLTEDNLTVKRPGEGISPMRWDEIIGSIAKKDYLTDELI
jgi:N,N'-diacetyllegionaminate synthase